MISCDVIWWDVMGCDMFEYQYICLNIDVFVWISMYISSNIDVYDLISMYMFEYQCISIRWIFMHMFDSTNQSSLSHDKLIVKISLYDK